MLKKAAGCALGLLAVLAAAAGGQAEAPLARIAYVERGDVWTMDAHGNDRRLILSDARSPDWSPDGARIAASTSEGIAIVPAGGGDPVLIQALGEDRLDAPQWSPDGTQIAFSRARGEQPGGVWAEALEVANPDGSGRRIVLERTRARPAAFLTPSAWTPDGTRLLYTTFSVGSPTAASVRSVALSGEDDRLILPAAVGAVPSPDGQRLAFRSLRGQRRAACDFCLRPGNLALSASDGTGRRTLLKTKGEEGEPTWSADGSRLAFTSARNAPPGVEYPDPELYTIGVDGSCLTWLTNDTRSVGQPDWSPAGRTDPAACGGGGRKPELVPAPGRRFAGAPWLGRRFGAALLSSSLQPSVPGGRFAYVDCSRFEPSACPPLFRIDSQSACEQSANVLFQTRRAKDFRRVGRAITAVDEDGRGIVYIGRWFVFVQRESGPGRGLVRRVVSRLRRIGGAPFGRTRVGPRVRRLLPARLRGIRTC